MAEYRVETKQVTETGAEVEAENIEEAIHLVKLSLGLAEEEPEDDVDAVKWDFPVPMERVTVTITSAAEVVDHA
jgi:hypothetical protein